MRAGASCFSAEKRLFQRLEVSGFSAAPVLLGGARLAGRGVGRGTLAGLIAGLCLRLGCLVLPGGAGWSLVSCPLVRAAIFRLVHVVRRFVAGMHSLACCPIAGRGGVRTAVPLVTGKR